MAVSPRTNSTPYDHPQETNLLNVHKAMEYNGQGEPVLRTLSTVDGSPSGTSAFGEPYGIQIIPRIQLDGLYGLNSLDFETFTASSGTATTERDMFKVSTGTSVGGYGVIRSKRLARYRPGQGLMCRFTASFTSPVAGTTQRAGFFSQEQALQVGFDGTQFGILRQNDGKAEIRVLTLSAGASGAETATITANGTSYTVSLTSGTTTFNSAEIAAAGRAGYLLDQEDGKVYFLSTSNGPQSGTWSFSSTGTAAGTFSQAQAGVADTNNWIYQEDFNIDKLDGTGSSGITIDFTKLNIFQISFRWLGAGEMRFAIENPTTGDMMYFHHIHYSNRNIDISLDNPSFRIGYVAANLSAGSVTDMIVRGGSMAAFNEGSLLDVGTPVSISQTRSTLNVTNTWHHILSIKSPLVYTNKVNLKNYIIERVSAAFQGNDPMELALIVNGTPSATLAYNKIDTTNNYGAYYSTTTATFTNPLTAFRTIVNINGAVQLDIKDLTLQLAPQQEISIAVRSSQAIAKITAAIVWQEI